MTTKEIYEKFDKVGCLSFATINEHGEPESRIAHLRAYDHEGMYFMTMFTKDFYSQLKTTGKVSICGLSAKTEVEHDENGLPLFENGYAIRMTGNVHEVPMETIKAKNNPLFDMCIKDQEKYQAMVVFCIASGRGYIFDYDFEQSTRENKLNRIYFAYNGEKEKFKGLTIEAEKCISCGLCMENCSFLAIKEDHGVYSIDTYRCDECGDCYSNCPANAIRYKGEIVA